MGIKRLFFDIETSPNIGLYWTAGYKQNISYESIIKERAIICIAYKWAGEKTTHSLQWDKHQNDKAMLKEFIKIAEQADEIVAHNGDHFDEPWIRTRCLFHGISMMPDYTSIDTLYKSRSKFKFNSNKIDYIAKFLGIPGKIHTNFDLWKKITLDNDEKSLNYMVKYCKGDVKTLEQVFDKLNSYIKPKTHHGVLAGGEKFTCPDCGSSNIRFVRKRATAAGTLKYQLQCKDCGKYFTVSEKVYREYLKWKNKK